jgi:copper resistance protein B
MKTLIAVLLATAAVPATAQTGGQDTPPSSASTPASVDPACPPEHAAMGHCVPKSAAAPAPGATAAPPAAPTEPSCPPEHAAMGHCTPAASSGEPAGAPADPNCPPEHAAMGHCVPKATAGAAAGDAAPQPSSAAPPVAPPPPAAYGGPEHAAETVFSAGEMAAAREQLRREHGAITTSKVLVDLLEARIQDGRDGYVVDAQAWYGGDIDRLWLKGEGESEFGHKPESVELQALWSHALDPWFNLQTGVRYDFRPDPERAYAVLGIQGLAPYWFEVDGALFLSEKGDLSARFEAEYDQRITQQLILQPRFEFDLAAQDVPELGIGAGLSKAEAGLRLRYEIVPEFAPYIGVNYERAFGDTADFARAGGEDVGGWSLVLGLRTWF